MIEINRCPGPKCGGVARLNRQFTGQVQCMVCGIAGPKRLADGEAIAAWNRLTMRPEAEPGPVGDFGEPWIESDRPHGHLLDRHGRVIAEGGTEFCLLMDYPERTIACVNALAGLNPEALSELIEAIDKAREHGRFFDPPVEMIYDALAKLRGEKTDG